MADCSRLAVCYLECTSRTRSDTLVPSASAMRTSVSRLGLTPPRSIRARFAAWMPARVARSFRLAPSRSRSSWIRVPVTAEGKRSGGMKDECSMHQCLRGPPLFERPESRLWRSVRRAILGINRLLAVLYLVRYEDLVRHAESNLVGKNLFPRTACG